MAFITRGRTYFAELMCGGFANTHIQNLLRTKGKRVPATISAIADAIRWAEEILREIDLAE